MEFYLCQDYSPVVGAVEGGKQAVKVYDSRVDGYREIVSTPEKVDEFINNRAESVKNANKTMILPTIVGALATVGSMFTSSAKNCKTDIALMGGMLTAAASLIVGMFAQEKAEEKVTQEFILSNKENGQ